MFLAIIFFLFMSFFLSGSETALTAVNKMKLKTRAENNDRRSQQLLSIVSKPDELITAILIGNNISNIMLPTLVTIIALQYGINVGVATGVLTIILIIFAEVLPKSIAATFADKIAYIVFPIIKIFMTLFKPLTFLLSKFTRSVIRILSKDNEVEVSFSRAELITMVDIASTEGTFENEETQRIKGVIDFYELDVRDAFKTPRMDIKGIPANSTYEEARDIVLNNNYTRYPVYKENMDDIVGMFHSKQLLNWSLVPEEPLDEFTDNAPLFVYEFHSIEIVFKRMLTKRKHIAVVLDEYGGTRGIITTEDIIEAMIGLEINDETDEDDNLIDEITASHIICNGKITLHRLNEVFETEIPEDEDILTGFLLKGFGHFPNEGEVFKFNQLLFKVKKIDGNKIKLVEIKKTNVPKN